MNYDVKITPEDKREIIKAAQRLARTWGIPDRSDEQSFDQALILAAYAAGCLRGHHMGRADRAADRAHEALRNGQERWIP